VQNGTWECVLCAVQNETGECVLCVVQNETGECVLCAVQDETELGGVSLILHSTQHTRHTKTCCHTTT
jgi:hypothetical protein